MRRLSRRTAYICKAILSRHAAYICKAILARRAAVYSQSDPRPLHFFRRGPDRGDAVHIVPEVPARRRLLFLIKIDGGGF